MNKTAAPGGPILTLTDEPGAPDQDLLDAVSSNPQPVDDNDLLDDWTPEDAVLISEYERRQGQSRQENIAEEETAKTRSVIFDDPDAQEGGFIAARGEQKLDRAVPDREPAGLSSAFPEAAGLGAGGLGAAGMPSGNGGFGAADAGPGGFGAGSDSGGSAGGFTGSYRNRWLMVRNPLQYRPITKWLDRKLDDLVSGSRDSNVILIRHGIRHVPTQTSNLVADLLQKRAQQLSMKPSEAQKAGLSSKMELLGQMRFYADPEMVAHARKQEKAHRSAQAGTSVPRGPAAGA